MTQTAQPDPFEDLLARVARLETGAASHEFTLALQDRLDGLEARLRMLERAVPIADPGPTRSKPPTADVMAAVAASQQQASQREEEAIKRAAEALRRADETLRRTREVVLPSPSDPTGSPFARDVADEIERRFAERFRLIDENLAAIVRRLDAWPHD